MEAKNFWEEIYKSIINPPYATQLRRRCVEPVETSDMIIETMPTFPKPRRRCIELVEMGVIAVKNPYHPYGI